MKANNLSIRKPVTGCKNEYLRTLLHNLPINGIHRTHDKDARRIALSLSRTTKKVSGTTFTVRDLGHHGFEIQCVRYVPRKDDA